jgi:hypothetical protein
MRIVTWFLIFAVLSPGVAMAETSESKLIKILAGGSAVVVGTAIAAKSSQTMTVSTPVGQTETSTSSSSQLITGLVIAGVGGLVLWSGLKEHRTSSPNTTIAISGGTRAGAILLRRSW